MTLTLDRLACAEGLGGEMSECARLILEFSYKKERES